MNLSGCRRGHRYRKLSKPNVHQFFPCGFQSKTCLVTLLVFFRRVCPIQVHCPLAVSLLMMCWSVFLHISLLMVLSCHLVFRMYLRHLLVNVCSIWVVVLVTLRVSETDSSISVTLVLKILICLCKEYTES